MANIAVNIVNGRVGLLEDLDLKLITHYSKVTGND